MAAYKPAKISALPRAVSVVAGHTISAALAFGGEVYTWGLGVSLGADLQEDMKRKLTEEGQRYDAKPVYEPRKVCIRASMRVEKLACGSAWCAVICCRSGHEAENQGASALQIALPRESSGGVGAAGAAGGAGGAGVGFDELDVVLASALQLALDGIISGGFCPSVFCEDGVRLPSHLQLSIAGCMHDACIYSS